MFSSSAQKSKKSGQGAIESFHKKSGFSGPNAGFKGATGYNNNNGNGSYKKKKKKKSGMTESNKMFGAGACDMEFSMGTKFSDNNFQYGGENFGIW